MKNTTILKQTDDYPKVELNEETNTLIIEGVSMPENAVKMFQPVFEQIHILIQKKELINLRIHLKYLNSMSSKQLLRLLFEIKESNTPHSIVWNYSHGDEIMKLKGDEIKSILELEKFEISEI